MQTHAALRPGRPAQAGALPGTTPRTLIAPEFDAAYYLECNEDVRLSGMDPFEHFLLHGAAELRNPNAWFDTGFYVRNNADVVDAEVNPFWHYLAQGRAGRRADSLPAGTRLNARSWPKPCLRPTAGSARRRTVPSCTLLRRSAAWLPTGSGSPPAWWYR